MSASDRRATSDARNRGLGTAVTRRRAIETVAGAAAAVIVQGASVSPSIAQERPALVIKPLAEKRVGQLPAGPLFWRIETFPSLDDARAAEGPTGLTVDSAGRIWLFTLGPPGRASQGGTTITEIGPIAEITAPRYLLRINQASGPPGSVTPVHTHPGSEVFYVVAGETSQRTPHGVTRVGAGQAMTGQGADAPMQVSSTGSTDLLSLVMFVVDATRPFSSAASMQ